jgi:hypothetical protein
MAIDQLNYRPIRGHILLHNLAKRMKQIVNEQRKLRKVHAGYLIDKV